jgi:hypothetical protein
MSQNDERRVLSRKNARELKFSECEQVRGAIIHTRQCTIIFQPNGTCSFEGDCEPPPGC